ncbi:MAG: multicopper oxidase domain-containing protein, partial [Paracoccaceae bacterium]
MSERRKYSRRNILKTSAGAAVLLGGGFGVFKYLTKPPNLDVVQSQPLPIPPLLTGINVDGRQVYDLIMQRGSMEFVVGETTQTFGYNGDILGPTLMMNKGDDVVINVTNNLGEPTTTHWHGLHLPANMDGGPHQRIEPGQTWNAAFTIMNEAATFFYHPHLMHKTGEQVYQGLAGMFIVNDPENQPDLPNDYGVDDIPLIIQDKSFEPEGTLKYSGDFVGVKGAYVMVNGAITPKFAAPAQLVRFRVLNGSNARIFNFGFSDGRQFHQIGTDGGLLEEPVPLDRLLLSPGERAEIIVDFSGQENQQVRLLSYSEEIKGMTPFWARDALDKVNFDVLTIDIKPRTAGAVPSMPDKLATITRLDESKASKTRKFELQMSMMKSTMTINGLVMDIDRIDHTIRLGDIEIWEISNPSDMFHPFHIHDIQFQILSRNGQPPPENERGWKDTVL